jgi:hypothetical protein
MRIRRMLAAVGAAALMSVGAVASAAPAAAQPSVDWEVLIDCTGPVYLPGQPGDSYAFILAGDCTLQNSEIWNAVYNAREDTQVLGFLSDPSNHLGVENSEDCWDFCGNDPGDWWVWNTTGTAEIFGGLTILATNDAGASVGYGGVVANLSVWGDGFSLNYPIYWGHPSGAGPTEYWTQGYGRASADATCDAGWSPSWDYWPNDGQGGWVCVREVPKYS